MPVFDSNIIVNGGYIDLQKGELRNAQIQNLTTAPSSPVDGQVYYNSVSHTFFIYNANSSTWVSFYPDTTTLDAITAPVASVSLNSQKITNLATPTAATDGANKGYVDGVANGISWKNPVRAASTANVTVATPGTTIDGVTLATNDRVLLKNQTTQTQNGLYQFNGSASALTRTVDADTGAELVNAACFVSEGSTNADQAFVQTTAAPITIGSSNIVFVQFTGGNTYTAGDALDLVGNQFNVKVDGTTIDINGSNELEVVSGAFPKKFTGTVTGDGTTTVFTVTHSLGTSDVVTAVRATSGTFADQYVIVDIAKSSTSAITLTFATAPANLATFSVTAIG